jgi:spermidine synthase
LLAAVALVSAAAIAYEILLMRVLSIVHWHHFAWMIISLALLGYGASGTAIALTRETLRPHFAAVFAGSALLFSIAMIVGLVLAQQVPFNALAVIWEPRQLLYLAVICLLFMLPFLFAAACIGLAFTCRPALVERIYFADLLGAGLGAALVIGTLLLLPPQRAVTVCAVLALLASLLGAAAGHSDRRRPALHAAQLAWLLCLVWLLAADRIGLHLSEFKGLPQALAVVEARLETERSGPLALLSVVDSPRVPLRHAPGLSFNTRHLPPEQKALFTDGDGISAITRFDGDAAALAWLGDVTMALPYQLLERPRVLVLGAGTGADVLLALHHGAAHVDAVELNPQVAGLMQVEYADYAGRLYARPDVSLQLAEARGFAARGWQRYDLVQVALLDSFAAAGSGVQALGESYLYTVEAVGQYLSRLEPGGLLAVTRWLQVPPRDSLKLAATVIAALRGAGVADPGSRLAMIRSWNTMTLLVKNGALTAADIARVQEFSRQRSFDLAWYPGMPAREANQYNLLDRPWLYHGVVALLGEGAERFIADYKFDIEPPTDNRPYFFDFFRWRVLPELLALRTRGGAGLIEWGYPLLVATLVMAAGAGGLLILLPLWLDRRRNHIPADRRMGAYFFLLGLAFLFVEMAFIQKFILFLSHPLYAVTVVLAGFLIFAGLGSLASGRLARCRDRRPQGVALGAVAAIGAVVLLYLWLLPVLFEAWIGFADAVRIALSLGLIAPLAFAMGMPFPLGLQWLSAHGPTFIPWAWALNGYASVISAGLATLLAIEAGFVAVMLAALLFYALAVLLFRSAD